jgi:hypothetical protein
LLIKGKHSFVNLIVLNNESKRYRRLFFGNDFVVTVFEISLKLVLENTFKSKVLFEEAKDVFIIFSCILDSVKDKLGSSFSRSWAWAHVLFLQLFLDLERGENLWEKSGTSLSFFLSSESSFLLLRLSHLLLIFDLVFNFFGGFLFGGF